MSDSESPVDEVKKAILDRLSHPVVGILVTAWLLSNWQMLYYLAVDRSPTELRLVNAVKFSTEWELIYLPIIGTLSYVLLAPILKALSLVYVRYVTEWEAARAHAARLRRLKAETNANEAFVAEQERKIHDLSGTLKEIQKKLDKVNSELLRAENQFSSLLHLKDPRWTQILTTLPEPRRTMQKNDLRRHFDQVRELEKTIFSEVGS